MRRAARGASGTWWETLRSPQEKMPQVKRAWPADTSRPGWRREESTVQEDEVGRNTSFQGLS